MNLIEERRGFQMSGRTIVDLFDIESTSFYFHKQEL